MDSESRCGISDLPRNQCYDCRHQLHGKKTPSDIQQLMTLHDEPRRKEPDPTVGPPIGTRVTAAWPGECNECENAIRPDQRIRRAADGTWVHDKHDPQGSIEAAR